VIEPLITGLVQAAPVLDASVVAELCGELRADARPLALAIARVVELVAAGAIDQAISLPALAMACATLCDPRMGNAEHEAARYEIDTLLPMPKTAPMVAAPDVPLTSLKRR
jgi:hypothetical protein